MFGLHTCAAIEKQDGGPSRAEIEAELQQIREIQAEDLVAQDQATGEHSVTKVYEALQTNEPLTSKELLGGAELRGLNARREALRIRPDGVFEIRLVINEKARWCVVCPHLSVRQ